MQVRFPPGTPMPAKNSIKEFVSNSYYHLYNRGVEKRRIFQDEQDYSVFLSYLKTYLVQKNLELINQTLSDSNSSPKDKDKALKLLRLNNFSKEIDLIAYCLMPNHFHLLVYQKFENSIDRFTNSIFTRYSMYFNKKYRRVGPLFQGLYKAVRVSSEEQLLWLSRYIHLNPKELLASQGSALQSYAYSSYKEYLKSRQTEWIKSNTILNYFKSPYRNFVEGNRSEPESLYPLLLE